MFEKKLIGNPWWHNLFRKFQKNPLTKFSHFFWEIRGGNFKRYPLDEILWKNHTWIIDRTFEKKNLSWTFAGISVFLHSSVPERISKDGEIFNRINGRTSEGIPKKNPKESLVGFLNLSQEILRVISERFFLWENLKKWRKVNGEAL